MIIDLYAGPGGWDEGARLAGIDDEIVGVEWETTACATAEAAGHARVQADVSALDPVSFVCGDGPADVTGIIASPPCTTLSLAGHGGGRVAIDVLRAAIDDIGRDYDSRAARRTEVAALLLAWAVDGKPGWTVEKQAEWAGKQATVSMQIVEPLRWAIRLGNPDWIALEQVPEAMPLWQETARHLRARGYSVWCGVLNSANFGVPQTRERAILIARRGGPAVPPEPTHAKHPQPTLFGEPEPWVSMAEALGWGLTGRPAYTVAGTTGEGKGGPHDGGSGTRRMVAAEQEAGRWLDRRTNSGDGHGGTYPSPEIGEDRPAPTVTGQARMWVVQTRGTATEKHPDLTADGPAPTVTGRARSWLRASSQKNAAVRSGDEPAPTMMFGHHANKVEWVHERPATTVQSTPRIGRPGHKDREGGEGQFERETVRVTIEEASVLQSFRADYPWQGSKTRRFEQIGNAVPPRLAAHVLAAATGRPPLDFTPTGG